MASPKPPLGRAAVSSASSQGSKQSPIRSGLSSRQINEALKQDESLPLGLPEVETTPMVRDFFEKFVPQFCLSNLSRTVLEAYSNIDVTAERVAQALKANPYYEFHFLKHVESLIKRERPKTEGAVVLLGMQNTRNLIIALQMKRTVSRKHAEWASDGKLAFAPNDFVKFGMSSQEFLSGDKTGYADTAYAAGIVFDYLVQVANERGGDVKKATTLIESIYQHGMKTAKIAMEVSKVAPDFGFKKFVFSASLIHGIGKVVMAIIDPGYFLLHEECSKRAVPRMLRAFIERKRYGMDHAMIAGLCCHYFKVFKPIERALFFQNDPYLLKSVDKNLHQLASVVFLATNIANNFKKIDKVDDPMIGAWKTPEIKDFNIDIRNLVGAVSRVPMT